MRVKHLLKVKGWGAGGWGQGHQACITASSPPPQEGEE